MQSDYEFWDCAAPAGLGACMAAFPGLPPWALPFRPLRGLTQARLLTPSLVAVITKLNRLFSRATLQFSPAEFFNGCGYLGGPEGAC